MSRYIDIETIKPRQYENSEVELGVLAYDYDEIQAIPFLDIVWCKECKYDSICTHSVQHTTHDAHSITIGYKSVDYCSYGERGASDDRDI